MNSTAEVLCYSAHLEFLKYLLHLLSLIPKFVSSRHCGFFGNPEFDGMDAIAKRCIADFANFIVRTLSHLLPLQYVTG